jgi:hypothetical protein
MAGMIFGVFRGGFVMGFCEAHGPAAPNQYGEQCPCRTGLRRKGEAFWRPGGSARYPQRSESGRNILAESGAAANLRGSGQLDNCPEVKNRGAYAPSSQRFQNAQTSLRQHPSDSVNAESD